MYIEQEKDNALWAAKESQRLKETLAANPVGSVKAMSLEPKGGSKGRASLGRSDGDGAISTSPPRPSDSALPKAPLLIEDKSKSTTESSDGAEGKSSAVAEEDKAENAETPVEVAASEVSLDKVAVVEVTDEVVAVNDTIEAATDSTSVEEAVSVTECLQHFSGHKQRTIFLHGIHACCPRAVLKVWSPSAALLINLAYVPMYLFISSFSQASIQECLTAANLPPPERIVISNPVWSQRDIKCFDKTAWVVMPTEEAALKVGNRRGWGIHGTYEEKHRKAMGHLLTILHK